MKRLFLTLLIICILVGGASASTQIWSGSVTNPTTGIANFTDVQATAQVVKPVVQGVTSVDNIDKSQLTGGNPAFVGQYLGFQWGVAQSFTANKTKMTGVNFTKSSNTGTPAGNLIFKLVTDSGGLPSTTVLASYSYTPATYNALPNGEFTVPLPAILSPPSIYWVAITDSTSETPDNTYYTPTGRTASGGVVGQQRAYSQDGGVTWGKDEQQLQFKEFYAKNTEDVSVTVNGVTANLISNGTAIGDATGLLSGSIINLDTGVFSYENGFNSTSPGKFSDAFSSTAGGYGTAPTVINDWGWTNTAESIQSASDTTARSVTFKLNTMLNVTGVNVTATAFNNNVNTGLVEISGGGVTYNTIIDYPASASAQTVTASSNFVTGNSTFYVRLSKDTANGYIRWDMLNVTALLNQTELAKLPTQSVIAGTNYYNISSNGRADSASLDPSMLVDVWLMGQGAINSLTANFAKNSTGGQAPLAVAFTDSSTNVSAKIDNWYWTFGDLIAGNTSTLQNPTHTYTTNGTHTINLTITNTSYSLVSTKLSNIIVNNTVQADFVGAPLSGYATTDVYFVDFSTNEGIYAWDWDFGDGGTSTDRNPTHPYTTAGVYNVSLTVTSVDGTSTKTETDYITITGVSDINPSSTYQFKPDANIIRNSTLYNRTIQMGNVTNATYAIGSTTFDAANIQVTRVLANKSTYSDISLVSSTMNNATGVVTFNVTRPGGFAPGASFVSIVDVEMLYYNYHTGTTGAAWGSGSLINGTYRNTFPVTYLSDAPLTYDWVTHSDFSISDAAPTSGVTVVTLTPSDHNETANRFLWNFGDGTTFLDHNGTAVTHVYTGVGPVISPFSTSLTAYLSANTSVTNTTIKTITPVYAADWVKANFTAIPVNGGVGLAVIFTDLSEFGTPGGQTYNWSFGDDFLSTNSYSNTVGSTSHVYTSLGTYTVKLTVNNTLNIDNETKLSYITVSNQQSTTFYSPKTTAFHIVDQYGNQIKGATVTANFNQSNLPPTATTWLVSNYGMNINAANEALDGALMMSGLTSDTGDITFVMIAALEYDITITYDGSSNRFLISPQNNFYQLKFLTASVADTSIGTCVYANGNTHSGIARPDIGNITFMFSYQDTCGTTVAVDYYVLDTDVGTMLYHYQLTPVTTGIYVNNYTVSNVRGKSYRWWQNSTRSV